MASREVALSIANGYIGTGENPAGSNKTIFAEIAGHLNGYAWCATFVVAVMRKAGIKLPSESAWTVAMNNGFQGSGAGVANLASGLQPGDVIFFDFVSPFNSRGIQHVGIFEKYLEPGYIQTIEGNTSSGDSGSQDNGDGVYRRKRPLKYIVAAGRPKYDPAATAPAPLPPAPSVRPEYDPALNLLIASGVASPNGGAWLVGRDGGLFAFGEAPFYGTPYGQDYWAGRQAVRIDATVDGGYTIYATNDPNGPGYHYGPGGPVSVRGPEYDPDLQLTIVADLKDPVHGGVWLLAADGAIYAFGTAEYQGAANGKDYFAGRTAARLELVGDKYQIIDSTGAKYGPGF